jgi:hypothetical protein
MARNPVRDERQGDLFGAPPPPAKPVRRTSPPRPVREETRAPDLCRWARLARRQQGPRLTNS